jgi:hypothetical protein
MTKTILPYSSDALRPKQKTWRSTSWADLGIRKPDQARISEELDGTNATTVDNVVAVVNHRNRSPTTTMASRPTLPLQREMHRIMLRRNTILKAGCEVYWRMLERRISETQGKVWLCDLAIGVNATKRSISMPLEV